MEFVPLREILPDVARKETRALTILQETHGLPVGMYGFVESYCNDPSCDCRRVFINVIGLEGKLQAQHLATIGYGWESFAFYNAWIRGDRMLATLLQGVHLERGQVQSEYAERCLQAFVRSILDERYTERIKRHYAAFKEAVRRASSGDAPDVARTHPLSGTEEHPIILRVPSENRALGVSALCDENGWKFIVGIEPDKEEDISELNALLSLRKKQEFGSVGRNEPCPCGSGKKFKKCHGGDL